MNYSRAIFLISDEVRAVEVTYESHEGAPRTVFKTLDQDIKVDDFVVVPTDSRHNMTVCKVMAVDIEPDLESEKDMKWIIGVVNRSDFEDISSQEGDAITKIKAAERRRKSDELRKTMLAGAEEDLKALPIYTAKDDKTTESK
ncbi:MAG: hypothetical protein QNK44_07920 [Hyphomicrobiaceae bacterium]|nr:hypothetical protein [Hyphomicrobiaceae bacterium]